MVIIRLWSDFNVFSISSSTPLTNLWLMTVISVPVCSFDLQCCFIAEDIVQPPRNDDSKSMTVGDVGDGNCHMFAADGDHIDFFDSQMYNNYR